MQSVHLRLSSSSRVVVDAVLSITAVNTGKNPFWRAVLTVNGEKQRKYGTRHRSALESAKKLLSKYPHRISAAMKKRVLGILQGDVRPRKHVSRPRSFWRAIRQADVQSPVQVSVGAQPSSAKPCRALRGKRKLNHEDRNDNPRATKKIATIAKLAGEVSDPVKKVAPIEKGKLGVLHYLLRMPMQTSGQPAPLLLFLHGSGERGKDDGSELYMVRKHGPWTCEGAENFFILAPQCPRSRVWSAFVDEVLLVLTDVCGRYVVDESRIYITGLSMGAMGAWSLALTAPEKFAAIASICGGFIGRRMPMETSRAQMLKLAETKLAETEWGLVERRNLAPCARLPAWLFHGKQDRIVHPKCSQFVIAALRSTGNENVRQTIYRNAGHACWRRAYNTLELYTWLLKHSQPLVH